MSADAMPIRRSAPRMLGWIAAGVALFGCAWFLFLCQRYVTASIPALVGIAAIAVACCNSYTTDCPVCGTRLTGLAGVTGCPECLTWGQVADGAYRALAPDFQAAFPVLALPLCEGDAMPPLCCACGAPATRTEPLRIIRLEFALDVDAPHCEHHSGGADLDAAPFSGEKGKTSRPVIKVKSYRFYRALAKANFPNVVRW